jgi:integrase
MKPIPFNSETTPWRVRVPARLSGTGKVMIKYFRTKSSSLDYIAKLQNERAKFGSSAITPDERNAIAHVRTLLKTQELDPKQLTDIVQHWLKTGEGAIHKRTLLASAEEYIVWTESQKQNFSKRTLSDIRWRIKTFVNEAADEQLHHLGEKEIQAFLDKQTEGWTRISFFKRLRPFFRWCKGQRIIARNPMEEMRAPSVGYNAPEIYDPVDMRDVLDHCVESGASDILPFVVCSGFGFLRTAELVRMYSDERVMQWENLLWTENLIHVPHGVAKRTKRSLGDERFIPMTEAFRHWLEPIKKDSGQIVPFQHNKFYHRLRDVIDSAGVEGVDNGFRHSCISYWIAANPETGIVRTAQFAGNSEQTTKRHYLRALKPDDASKWWGIRRETAPDVCASEAIAVSNVPSIS